MAAITVLFGSTGLAFAQSPLGLSFQGRLEDPLGTPVTGATTLTARLYTTSSTTTAVWVEEDLVDLDDRGVFVTTLGDVTPIDDVDFSRPLWVGMTLGDLQAGPELSPRLRLWAAPQAMFARSAGRMITSTSGMLELDDDPTATPTVLQGRSLVFTKRWESSRLRVTYSDTFRVVIDATAAAWEVYLDGARIGDPGPLVSALYGQTSNSIHRRGTLVGYAQGVAAGVHTLDVRLGRVSGYSPAEAYTGWNSTYLLEVEEIPTDP